MDTELLNKMADIITEKELLIQELMEENKKYKDAIDRQNKYIESNRTAIIRFDESNRGNWNERVLP